ncbi:MAG: hypothetical protein R2850_05900 [Bacteroidia bacterium]
MMKRTTRFISILLIAVLMHSCRSEDETSWETAVLAPLAEATISVTDLIPDSLISSDAGTPVYLRVEFNEDIIEKDSVLRIPDTIITDQLQLPVNLVLPAGFEVADISQQIKFSYRDVKLTEALIEEGFVELNIYNYLEDKVIFEYTIPKATFNGMPLAVSGLSVEAHDGNDPGFYQYVSSLQGYHLDLRGDDLLHFNRIRYLFNALLNPDGLGSPVTANEAFVRYRNRFYGIKPYFARGYLGQSQFHFSGGSDLSFMRNISGIIELEDISLHVSIENSIGADFSIRLNSVSGIRDGNSVSLNHEIIGNDLAFARAQHIGYMNLPYTPYSREFDFNQSTSNIKPFVEFLPQRIEYDIDAQLNPLGNVSSGNDFAYSSSNVRLKSVLEMPLKFRAENLSFKDTVKFEGINPVDVADIGDGELRVFAHNGFPMDMKVELTWLDTNLNVLGSNLIDQVIAAAPVDNELKVISSQKTILNVPVTNQLKSTLENCRFIAIKAVFDTKPQMELLPIYPEYQLKLQVIGDGIYTIRTK